MIHLPEAFMNKMKYLLKDEFDAFYHSYQCERNAALRINTLKIDTEHFKQISPFTLEPVPWTEEGFYYPITETPGKHPYHLAGLYYIQEASAMAVAKVLNARPGDIVLDLCAAPGGKSTQIAAAMRGYGFLVSNEIITSRASILAENMERLGVKNALITNETPEKLSKGFVEFFDKILVDAPCSGEGMFRKEPKACAEWNMDTPVACAKRQLNILNDAAAMLKSGGRLVYSTCTFSPEENEGIIERFLQLHDEFEIRPVENLQGLGQGRPEWVNGREDLKRCIRLWPHKQKGEGHFIALLEKKNRPGGKNTIIKKQENQVAEHQVYRTFEKENLVCKLEGYFLNFGEHLYLLPNRFIDLKDLKGLKVLRPGLHLGIMKKGRFEPSHALVKVLNRNDLIRNVNLKADDAYVYAEVFRYLGGQTLDMQASDTQIANGWTGVLVDGFPLGWGKMVDGVLKNHYPKGLRINF